MHNRGHSCTPPPHARSRTRCLTTTRCGGGPCGFLNTRRLGEMAAAHAAFDAMEMEDFVADSAAFSALMDACARNGDVAAARKVLKRMQRRGMPVPAPVWTGLVRAHDNAGARPEVCRFDPAVHPLPLISCVGR